MSVDRNGKERELRVRQVVDECIGRRVAGETLADEQILREHPDLIPDLADVLRGLALVEQAERRFRSSSGAAGDSLGGYVPGADAFPGYDVVGEIRRGGQGTVYQAVQRRTGRTVAIKLIQSDPAQSADSAARFEREIQILGQLKHPNILAIHDAGTTPGGSYYVADYISGDRLDEFVAGQEFSVDEVLSLFGKTCDAVNAAHLRGVIHRDLKPGNILVDQSGEPHVLDFGLAKVVSGEMAEHTMTESGQFLGSLPWASPEQVAGSAHQVDTRADVYALGVLLYQMLTGRFPYPVTGSVSEVVGRIRTAAPLPPRKLRRGLNDEVETLVLKCLSKEPERRYQTAGELARDVRRYLSGEPIEAKRDSVGYILGKHLRRHKLAVGIAASFVLMITVGLAVSLMFWRDAERARAAAQTAAATEAEQRAQAEAQAQRAAQETANARAVLEFLNEDLLGAADPLNVPNREVTVREVLDAASRNVAEKFVGQPLIEAAVRMTVGTAYQNLGQYDQAGPHLQRALELRQSELGEDDQQTADAAEALGMLYRLAGRFDEVEPLLVKAAQDTERVLGREHPECLSNLDALASLYRAQGRYREAELLLLELAEVGRRVQGGEHPDSLAHLNNLALLYQDRGRLAEAEPLCVKIYQTAARVVGAEHWHTLTYESDLALLYNRQGRYADAEPLFVHVLEGRRRLFGADHPSTIHVLNNLGTLYLKQGRYAEAEATLSETLAAWERVLGPDHPETLTTVGNLAVLYRKRGRLEEAEKLYRRTLEGSRLTLGPEHPATLRAVFGLGVLNHNLKRFAEAEPLLLEAMNAGRRALGPEHQFTLDAMRALALLYIDLRRYDEAEGLLAAALEGFRRGLGEEHPSGLACLHTLGVLQVRRECFAEAETLFAGVIASRRRVLGEDHPDTLSSMRSLAALYGCTNRHAEAEPLARELVTRWNSTETADPNERGAALELLGEILFQRDQPQEAADVLRECLAIRRAAPAGDPLALVRAESLLGECLVALGDCSAAEALLLGCYGRLAELGESGELRRATCRRVVQLYERCGSPEQAAPWRERLSDGAETEGPGAARP